MKSKMKILILTGLSVVFGLNNSIAQNMSNDKKMEMMMADLKSWPEASQMAAMDMMTKYGKPNEGTEHMLVWYNNGPWKRTIVYNVETKHIFPVDHTDVMEQWIDYNVPEDKFAADLQNSNFLVSKSL